MRRTGKRFSFLLGCLLLLAGVALVAYPHLRRQIYRAQADRAIAGYERQIAELAAHLGGEGADALYESMRAYNKVLFEDRQSGLVDASAYERVDFSLVEYGFAEEMIGYLAIPKMEVTLPVYLGANEENMEKGAAHMTQTSIPVGGENTKAVIAAHRDISTAVMFRDIDRLEPGDRLTFTNFRETLTYEVRSTQIIRPNDVDAVLIEEGRDLLTLLTCHPYRSNSQRYLVHCERVEP